MQDEGRAASPPLYPYRIATEETWNQHLSLQGAARRRREAVREFISQVRADRDPAGGLPVVLRDQDLLAATASTRIGNNLVAGLSNGSIWALVALGYTLVYGIIELINFAHGEVFMIGSFVGFGLYGTFGLTPRPAPSGWSSGCSRS